MPASRVTSRRLSAVKLRSSRSSSAAATIARRVTSLRSSRDRVSRERDEPERLERDDVRCCRELGVRLVHFVKPTTTCSDRLTIPRRRRTQCTYVHSNFDAPSECSRRRWWTSSPGRTASTATPSSSTPTWTLGDARAKVVAVRRQTPRSVTLTLEPNGAFAGFRAGQHINLTVEIDGRRRTRPYSPASAEGAPFIELTVGRHDGGLVSNYLYERARPGMVVGLDSVGGDFVLPDHPAATDPVRLRRQRNHPGDVDAADHAGRRFRPRDRLHPLRAQRRGSLLPRRARRHAER